MLLITPGYRLTSSGKLLPAGGGCVLVSGGRLMSNGEIRWDHEALTAESNVKTFDLGTAQERTG